MSEWVLTEIRMDNRAWALTAVSDLGQISLGIVCRYPHDEGIKVKVEVWTDSRGIRLGRKTGKEAVRQEFRASLEWEGTGLPDFTEPPKIDFGWHSPIDPGKGDDIRTSLDCIQEFWDQVKNEPVFWEHAVVRVVAWQEPVPAPWSQAQVEGFINRAIEKVGATRLMGRPEKEVRMAVVGALARRKTATLSGRSR